MSKYQVSNILSLNNFGPLDEGSGGGHDCEAGGVFQVHGSNQEDREVQQGHQQEPGAVGDRQEATQGRGETLE